MCVCVRACVRACVRVCVCVTDTFDQFNVSLLNKTIVFFFIRK